MNDTNIGLSFKNSWGRDQLLYRVNFGDIVYYIQTINVEHETLFLFFCKKH